MIDNRRLLLYPMVIVAAMFIIGMFAADSTGPIIPPILWFAAFIIVLLLALSFHRFAFRYVQSLLVLLACLLAGGSLMSFQNQRISDGFASIPCNFEAVVASPPVVKEKSVQMDLLVSSVPHPFKVRATLLRDSLAECLTPGAGLRAFGSFEKPMNRYRSSFDYRKYLLRHGYRSTIFLLPYEWDPAQVSLRNLSAIERSLLSTLKIRQKLIDQYAQQGFKGQDLAILAAMTLGQRQQITPELKEAFNISGGAHVLALSGLHLGILFMVFTFVFRIGHLPLRFDAVRRVVSVVVLLLAIWCFAVLVGMSPSIVRSAFMLSVFCLLQLLDRRSVSINVLAFSAVCLLCLNPQSLFDAGFQLSFASVASILLFYRPIFHIFCKRSYVRGFGFRKIVRWVWGFASVSLAAQIGAAPLVACYFGRFSCYFLLTNFVVVPLAYLIIVGTLFFWLLAWWPWAQLALSTLLMYVTKMLTGSLQWIAGLPGASIESVHLNGVGVACCYVAALSLLAIYHLLHGNREFNIDEADEEYRYKLQQR